MQLIVIRHGETDLNKENRLQGSKGENVGLNPDGIKMVETLRDGLLSTPTRMFVSPLVRTQETAVIINQRFGVPITLVPELVERDFGTLSGKLRTEVDPALVESDLEGKYDYHPFGGESVDDVRTRILRFLSTLPLETDETVFIVTHRGVVRLLYDLFPGAGLSNEVLPASKHSFEITALPE
jgi:broad specificity phosphatase PhoE